MPQVITCCPPTRQIHTPITRAPAIRLNFSQAHVRKMVMDSLRYWKNEMHIDGFPLRPGLSVQP